jgi:hypothetical protein
MASFQRVNRIILRLSSYHDDVTVTIKSFCVFMSFAVPKLFSSPIALPFCDVPPSSWKKR